MSWFRALFRRKAHEQKLDAELRFHLEQQIGDHVAAGMSPEEARRQAAIQFGGLDQIKERCREVPSGRWFETTLQDLRFGIRAFARAPGFTAMALATLGVGIGANAAIFSFVDGVLLKPGPFPDANRMVWVREIRPKGGRSATTTLTYLDWAKQNTVFENIAALSSDSATLNGIENPVQLPAQRVSADFFDVFRVRPALGRTFVEGEDQPGRDHVAVISHALWASQFGADPGVIGRVITLDGEPCTVIGVMPKGFFDRIHAQISRPLVFTPENMSRDYHWLPVVARLKPGVTIEQAGAEMDAIGKRIARDYSKEVFPSNKDFGVAVDSFSSVGVDRDLRQSLFVLTTAVGTVLLIVCANLANLTLARGKVREREIAIRAALGAGRRRLVRQFLTESLLLSSAGGILGLLLAYGGVAALKMATVANSLPPTADIAMDGRVLLFALGLSLLTGIIFGLIPAIRASRPDLTRAIKAGGPGASTGRALQGLRAGLVITEVALAFMLLSGAGLLIRSFFQLQKFDTGFDSANIVTAHLPISDKRFPSAAEFNLYLHRIVARIESLPGVRNVALTVALPLGGWGFGMRIRVLGAKTADPNRLDVFFKQVTPSYFPTLGIGLAKGRLLTERDVKGTPPVTVINQSLASKYFPNEDPVGKRILVSEFLFAKTRLGPEVPWEVVGVVVNEKVGSFGDRNENYPGMYVPEAQSLQTSQFLVVRSAMDPAVLQRSIRDAVRGINRDQVLDQMKTLEQIKADSMGSDRLRSSLLAIFAGTALLLAGMGLYGVISYLVMQRTREIGIRAALGATSTNILVLVLRSGMTLTCIGLVIGIGGALGLSQFLAFMLFNIGKYDPVTLVAAGGMLFVTALLASYIPARRAMKVNPTVALRCE